ncbi:MAG: hypothetical protein ACJAVK_003257 [Akkermansiaceae bacterium]
MIEETFFLYPPDWMKTPPNPVATKLFKKYVSNSPKGTFPEQTSTYQGLYCLGADGTYLSGKFARQSNEVARETLTTGLARWQKIAGAGGFQSTPVPTNRLALYGGEELRKGGLKLEVAYRDLPRGEVLRPGNAQFPNPYNLGWFDLTQKEAQSIATNSRKKTVISDGVFQKLARTRLKDAVRGQMQDWKEGDIKEGQLFSQLVSTKGGKQTYGLSGSAVMASGGLRFEPQFHGTATYDSAAGAFTDFRLIAAGQRAGKGGANGRAIDLGPAPMAIAFTLYQP